MNIESVKNKIKEENLLIFTAQDLQHFLGVSETNAQKIAERYTKRGAFKRLKRGYYVLSSNIPHSFYIANYIYQPSYISFESALSYYRLIPESVYAVVSATPKTTKSFEVLGKDFKYSKIKKQAFKGYCKKKVQEQEILIAEPEKALADYLYHYSLGKLKMSDRLAVKDIDRQKLFDYIELFDRENLKKLAKKHL